VAKLATLYSFCLHRTHAQTALDAESHLACDLQSLIGLGTVNMRTIGQVAREIGIKSDTIRYYECAGLLSQPARSRSGYRVYADKDVTEIREILRLKGLGLTIREIRVYVDARGPDARWRVLADLLQGKLRAVETELVSLQNRRDALRAVSAQVMRRCSSDPRVGEFFELSLDLGVCSKV